MFDLFLELLFYNGCCANLTSNNLDTSVCWFFFCIYYKSKISLYESEQITYQCKVFDLDFSVSELFSSIFNAFKYPFSMFLFTLIYQSIVGVRTWLIFWEHVLYQSYYKSIFTKIAWMLYLDLHMDLLVQSKRHESRPGIKFQEKALLLKYYLSTKLAWTLYLDVIMDLEGIDTESGP